jgi:hypothetical protein
VAGYGGEASMVQAHRVILNVRKKMCSGSYF